jgi:hypothetical protein
MGSPYAGGVMDALKDISLLGFLVLFGFAALIHNTAQIIKRLGNILESLRRIEERIETSLYREPDAP